MAARASRNPVQIRQFHLRFTGPGAFSCRFIVFARIAYTASVRRFQCLSNALVLSSTASLQSAVRLDAREFPEFVQR